ncbi:FAD-dependent oxidoreductase [Nonomuraea rhizosphaerae]|uniref:FAD-dependent oxidoreductase n=1 Tax=Nonomuraea rhizosphaerae TaxID=2665663 RepID=UPI001C5F14DB|nr:FAD-binding oxidoreductase [Nonomuraea rhizosphaerae]
MTVYDLAIVGGGMFGCLAGDEAARRHPDWNMLLLDRSGPAAGATGWSLAADIPFALTPAHRDLIEECERQWRRLAGEPAASLARGIRIVYVTGQDRLPALQAQLGERKLREASPAEMDTVRRMLPDVRIGAHELVVTHDEPGSVLPSREFVRELLRAGPMKASTRLATPHHVTAVRGGEPWYELACESGDLWRARRVILATGPWRLPHLPATPAPFTRSVVKRVAALRVALPVRAGDPIVFFPEDDLYVLPSTDGTAMVSFNRRCWGQDPDLLDGSLEEADRRSGVAVLAARCTAAAGRVVGGQAFCDRYTDDRLPYVWRAPRLAAMLAGSGSGVRLAPGMAARAVSAL